MTTSKLMTFTLKMTSYSNTNLFSNYTKINKLAAVFFSFVRI